MERIGVKMMGDIHGMDVPTLELHFGCWGTRLYDLRRGIDHNPVVSKRICVELGPEQLYRLVHVGLRNFQLDEPVPLFDSEEAGLLEGLGV